MADLRNRKYPGSPPFGASVLHLLYEFAFIMNRLSTAKRAQSVAVMTEGNSLRAITRMTGASINTVAKRLVDLGAARAECHDANVRSLSTKRVEADDAWTFCYARRDNVPAGMKGALGVGDVWTWVGMDADSKLVVSWTCGRRDADTAWEFMHDLASRLKHRARLTTDGLNGRDDR